MPMAFSVARNCSKPSGPGLQAAQAHRVSVTSGRGAPPSPPLPRRMLARCWLHHGSGVTCRAVQRHAGMPSAPLPAAVHPISQPASFPLPAAPNLQCRMHSRRSQPPQQRAATHVYVMRCVTPLYRTCRRRGAGGAAWSAAGSRGRRGRASQRGPKGEGAPRTLSHSWGANWRTVSHYAQPHALSLPQGLPAGGRPSAGRPPAGSLMLLPAAGGRCCLGAELGAGLGAGLGWAGARAPQQAPRARAQLRRHPPT
jgi:hypothetical protein